jgi:predicted RNA-binding Zn-ribbon protein involved in translation (DUF1610 family)
MKRRLAAERCLSTDAIVRQRLAGGEDAFLETLFGPFLVLPKNWRERFPYGYPPVDHSRWEARKEASLAGWIARWEREKEEARQRKRDLEAAERIKWPYRGTGIYTCPRCGRQQWEATASIPKWGTMMQCPDCDQVQQFQPSGMLPYEFWAMPQFWQKQWRTPGSRLRLVKEGSK